MEPTLAIINKSLDSIIDPNLGGLLSQHSMEIHSWTQEGKNPQKTVKSPRTDGQHVAAFQQTQQLVYY